VKDIKEAIAKFTNVIQKAAWSATPDHKPQTKYPEYPWEVKDQIKEKRKLRRRWQMTNSSTYNRPSAQPSLFNPLHVSTLMAHPQVLPVIRHLPLYYNAR
jgi:hypothetical protein